MLYLHSKWPSYFVISLGFYFHMKFPKNKTVAKISKFTVYIQCSPFITLCLRSIEMDHDISESLYKRKFLGK